MDIQDWGAIGDFVGGIAIIVSLVYVGVQIKQSTAAARAATSQAFSAQYTDHMVRLQNVEFRDVFIRGLKGLDQLDAGEQVAFFSYLNGVMRMFESFYLQKRDGSFDSAVYDSWTVQLVDLFGNSGAQEYWSIRRHTFTQLFANEIEQIRASDESRPMYIWMNDN